MRPKISKSLSLENRGSREDRVLAAPEVSCARCTEKCAHEHTGSAETLRPSLRNGFTAYNALFPATNSSCHRRQRIKADQPGWADFASAGLTSATDARTTRLHRTQPVSERCSARKCTPNEAFAKPALAPFVCAPDARSRETRPAIPFRADAAASTASQPAFVTIAIRPSMGETGGVMPLICPTAIGGIFLREGVDSFF